MSSPAGDLESVWDLETAGDLESVWDLETPGDDGHSVIYRVKKRKLSLRHEKQSTEWR